MTSLKSDLSYWLKKFNIEPNQRLGQCFLVSEFALKKVIAASNIKSGENILEIGSGTGILTEKLLARGANVLAIEKDSRLALILHERFDKERKIGRLKIIQTDYLDLLFPETLERLGWKSKNYKVVANLPYQITSPTIERLLERDFLPTLIVLTIQKEVAERICAKPGDLSSLAVMVQTCSKEQKIYAKFPASYFYPAPEVDSALIKIQGISYPKEIDIKKLRQVVQIGFSQKRKKLKKNLQNIFPKEKIEEIWKKLNINENARAQELEINKWLEIASKIDIPKI